MEGRYYSRVSRERQSFIPGKLATMKDLAFGISAVALAVSKNTFRECLRHVSLQRLDEVTALGGVRQDKQNHLARDLDLVPGVA